MRKKLIKDCFLPEFFRFKMDIESTTKISEKIFYKENINIFKNKGFFIFLSPRFSNLIRLLSEMSFEFFRILKNIKFYENSLKKNTLITFFFIGISLLNIVIELNFSAPGIKPPKKKKFSEIFFIKNYGKKILTRNFRNLIPNFFFSEFFFLSKGILIESFGLFFNKKLFLEKFSLKSLLTFSKFFSCKEIRYNFGLIHLLILNNSCIRLPSNKLFIRKFFGKISLTPKNTKGLYFGTNEILLMEFFYLSFFGLFYSRKEKLSFLSKTRILLNYNFFFTGILGLISKHQLHLSSLYTFSLKKENKKNCIGRKKKKNSLSELLKFSFKIKKNLCFSCVLQNFPNQEIGSGEFIQKKIFPEYDDRKKVESIQKNLTNKSIQESVELYSSLVSVVNLGFLKFYEKWSPNNILDTFIKKIFPISLNLPISFRFFLFFELNKKKKDTKLDETYGEQIENFLKFFFKKYNKNIYFFSTFQQYYIPKFFQTSFFPRILSRIYRKFSFLCESYKIQDLLEKNNILISENIFTKNLNNIESKILKKRDSIDLKYFTKFFFYIGNLTQNGKYFEVISRKIFKEKWLAKKSLGFLFLRRKKYLISKIQYLLSLSVFPQDVENWFNLGFVSLKLRDYKTSANCFFKVLKEEPNNNHAWSNLISIFSTSYCGKKGSLFLKIAIKNEIVPFFILKKYLIHYIDRKKIFINDILKKMVQVIQKKIILNSEIFFLALKLIVSFLEIHRKKQLICRKRNKINRSIKHFFWKNKLLSVIFGFFLSIVKKKMAYFLFRDFLNPRKFSNLYIGRNFFYFSIFSEEIVRIWNFS